MLLLFNVDIINFSENITFFTLVATVSSISFALYLSHSPLVLSLSLYFYLYLSIALPLSLFFRYIPHLLFKTLLRCSTSVCLCVCFSAHHLHQKWWMFEVRFLITCVAGKFIMLFFLQWHRFERALRQYSSILHFNHWRSHCKCVVNAKQTFFIFSRTLTVCISEFLRFTKLKLCFFFFVTHKNQQQQI